VNTFAKSGSGPCLSRFLLPSAQVCHGISCECKKRACLANAFGVQGQFALARQLPFLQSSSLF